MLFANRKRFLSRKKSHKNVPQLLSELKDKIMMTNDSIESLNKNLKATLNGEDSWFKSDKRDKNDD